MEVRFMGLFIALVLTVAVPMAAAAAPAPGLSFVQATVVTPDASARTLTFVDASGRSRSHQVTGAAAARVGRLRPGDEVIVVLAGAEGIVQDVKVSHASVSVPAPEVVTPAADPDAQWTVVPSHEMRPTWPNPYSRFYRGPRPAPPPRQR